MAKARRGDLAGLAVARSYTPLNGSVVHYTTYELGVVASVTVGEGLVKKIEAGDPAEHSYVVWPKSPGQDVVVVHQEELAVLAKEVVAAVVKFEVAQEPDELRDLVRPWLARADIFVEKWPNGQGASLGGHNVVPQEDGTVTVGLATRGDGCFVESLEGVDLDDSQAVVERVRQAMREAQPG